MGLLKRIRQAICRHQYELYTKRHPSGFVNISGDRHYIICSKCGHEKGSYFLRHD